VSGFIDQNRARFGVELSCRTLEVSASAYYHRRTGECSQRALEDRRLLVVRGFARCLAGVDPWTEWPAGAGWVLHPKYDGWRLLAETKTAGRVCAWSRNGTSLTARLAELLAPIAALGAGWVFDGELIALSYRAGSPVQDFAAVGPAVFGGDHDAIARLHYVAFDVLAAGEAGDIQSRPLHDRAAMLADRFPADRRLRVVSTLPADPDTHARLVSIGFEGRVLKYENSSYRGGRSRSCRKLKAST
jgi:ATP-dependent DNA ligase